MSTTPDASTLLAGASDWHDFRVNAQVELRRQGVFTLIASVIQADTPTNATAAVPGATPAPGSTITGLAFKDQPEERNSRALGVILDFLSPELRSEFLDEKSAAALWAKLRHRFESENKADTAAGLLAICSIQSLRSMVTHSLWNASRYGSMLHRSS